MFGHRFVRIDRAVVLMDNSRVLVYQYLISRGFASVVREPDGKCSPDFLVDGRSAVQVRRLNQNEGTQTRYRGIEEVSKPLRAVLEYALVALGPPINGTSWFVFYTFSRPLPSRKTLKDSWQSLWNGLATSETCGIKKCG